MPSKDEEEIIDQEEKEAYLRELINCSLSSKRTTQDITKNLANELKEVRIDEREYLHKDDIIKTKVSSIIFVVRNLIYKGGNHSYQPKHADHKFASKINLGMYEHPMISSKKVSQAEAHDRRQEASLENRRKDKSQRATTEQVLDPRTRLILQKMLQRQLLKEIHGCISTGKEANVYHAMTESGEHRALKVYKTSILVFKDRLDYLLNKLIAINFSELNI